MDTLKVSVYKDGQDIGWLGDRQNWWFDTDFAHSFSIFDIDAFYQGEYFGTDHVDEYSVSQFVDTVLEWGKKLLGRDVVSVLELGCGGGWYTEEFLKRAIDIVAVEGS